MPLRHLYVFILAWLTSASLPLQARLQLNESGESYCYVDSEHPQQTLLCLPKDSPFLSAHAYSEHIRTRLGGLRYKQGRHNVLSVLSVDSITQRQDLQIDLYGRVGTPRQRGLRFVLNATLEGPGHLRLRAALLDAGAYRLHLHYREAPDNVHFGFGEQFGGVAFDHERIRLISEENGIGRGDKGVTGLTRLVHAEGDRYSSYFPIPWAMGSDLRGIYVQGGTPLFWDFRLPGQATIEAAGDHLVLQVWHRASPLALLSAYTECVGRLPALPDWAWGAWYGIQGGSDKCEAIVDQALSQGVPLSAIWIQDWVGKRETRFGSRLFWNWQADGAAYPDLRSFIRKMRQRGIHVLGYINPFLATESALLDSARAYLIPDPNGAPLTIPAGGFDAQLFDLVGNDSTHAYLVRLIRREMIALGFSGWMADFGEWYPWQKWAGDSADFWAQRNRYPAAWQAANRAAITGQADTLLFFSRSGSGEALAHGSTYWTGDQLPSFTEGDGLPSALRAMLSGGMSGISVLHSDVGGYTNVHAFGVDYHRDHEIFARWCEFGAFSPIFRTHEGLQPGRNVQPWTDSSSCKTSLRMTQLHASLRPYLKAVNQEAAQAGWPMVRQLWLHYPDDPETRQLDREYLLGSDLLVIPVLAAGEQTVMAYFPKGRWRHLLHAETIEGPCWQRVGAPLGRPAAYWRADSPWAARWSRPW
jgi:sulfoquinovosidase